MTSINLYSIDNKTLHEGKVAFKVEYDILSLEFTGYEDDKYAEGEPTKIDNMINIESVPLNISIDMIDDVEFTPEYYFSKKPKGASEYDDKYPAPGMFSIEYYTPINAELISINDDCEVEVHYYVDESDVCESKQNNCVCYIHTETDEVCIVDISNKEKIIRNPVPKDFTMFDKIESDTEVPLKYFVDINIKGCMYYPKMTKLVLKK